MLPGDSTFILLFHQKLKLNHSNYTLNPVQAGLLCIKDYFLKKSWRSVMTSAPQKVRKAESDVDLPPVCRQAGAYHQAYA